ncbi:MAG TPA: DUF1543 domain-containing protein [Mucilaginibacter sp.]|jgi:hypothetical protein|nr:DUF1543 domain-containing protein [Mucilaginibacter sp.]
MMSNLRLFMLLLGCKPRGRHTEQHDIFFGVATSVQELVPEIKAFWPETRIHADAWREVTAVEGYQINVSIKDEADERPHEQERKLFFINLGGYQENRFEEQHHILLTVKKDKATAITEAKNTLFFQHNHFGSAYSHIDDKYGIDVDDFYQVEEMLSPFQKEKYKIEITTAAGVKEDPFHLGYLKLME